MSTSPGTRLPVLDRRRSGVLLHPSALPAVLRDAQHGAPGTLGASARAFIDWQAAAGCSVWQVLPLGPVGADGSPYWVRSDRAGNPALIDLDEAPDPRRADGYATFCAQSAHWLEDYVLFAALSRTHRAAPWWEWPVALRDRDPASLSAERVRLAAELESLRIEQWQFDQQWTALRQYARKRGVRLFGDLPIYLAPDSVATWTERAQFQLDAGGKPAALAGVPPDYFAADGQLWGNPLYDWDQATRDGFAFWRARFASVLERFDLVRIDHFRGLAGYWSVPAGATTARDGQWRVAPGAALLEALRDPRGDLPVVAEDLGVITSDVEALRRQFGLPGMRVLQFGFDGSPGNPHLPYNYSRDCVAYTGTHDNDTTLGWYRGLEPVGARRVREYLGVQANEEVQGEPQGAARLAGAAVRACVASVAELSIVPLQDVLALGSEARFNTPGTVGGASTLAGNWLWRCPSGALTSQNAALLRVLNQSFGRVAD